MGSAAVADLSRSAVREAGMAPQAVDVCLAMAPCLSRSNGVSSELRQIFEEFDDVAWMLNANIPLPSSEALASGDKKRWALSPPC